VNSSPHFFSGFCDPIPDHALPVSGRGLAASEADPAQGLASELLDLYGGGSFSFWQWNATKNLLVTHGAFGADSLEDWMVRIHPRDQAAFSHFIDQSWTPAPPYASIDYRFNANRQGDWIRVRHTAGLVFRDGDPVVGGLIEELSSPHLTRTLLERTEGEMREGESRMRRFIDGALELSSGCDPLPLLDLIRSSLNADTVTLVHLDSRLAVTGILSSTVESATFHYKALRLPLIEALSGGRSPGSDDIFELDLDPDGSGIAWFIVRPVLIGNARIAGVLCAGFRTPRARIAARRFRSLLSLASTFTACRLGREQEELQRRDLLSQLRQAQKLSSLGRLTGGFAHDLKNLLTLIQGHLHLLGEAFESGDWSGGRESLNQIREASDQATDFSGRLLLFGGRQEVELRPCDLNRLVERFATMMRRVLEENIEIRLDLDPAIGAIRADEGMLREVLMNLIVNARDAMSRGGVVTIATRPVLDKGSFVSLFVTDDGRPGHSHRLPGLLDPATLIEADTTGSGLGLHHVASIIAEHGGRIESFGTGDRGNAFNLLFPVEELVPESGVVPIESPRKTSGRLVEAHLKGTTILLVEDEAAVRKLVRKLLEVLGCSVIEAASGREALDLWPGIRANVSMVVSDIVMPEGVSGWDLARELHHHHPDLGILLTSGYSETPEDHGLGDISQIEFLQKPYGVNALKASLARLADLRPA